MPASPLPGEVRSSRCAGRMKNSYFFIRTSNLEPLPVPPPHVSGDVIPLTFQRAMSATLRGRTTAFLSKGAYRTPLLCFLEDRNASDSLGCGGRGAGCSRRV